MDGPSVAGLRTVRTFWTTGAEWRATSCGGPVRWSDRVAVCPVGAAGAGAAADLRTVRSPGHQLGEVAEGEVCSASGSGSRAVACYGLRAWVTFCASRPGSRRELHVPAVAGTGHPGPGW